MKKGQCQGQFSLFSTEPLFTNSIKSNHSHQLTPNLLWGTHPTIEHGDLIVFNRWLKRWLNRWLNGCLKRLLGCFQTRRTLEHVPIILIGKVVCSGSLNKLTTCVAINTLAKRGFLAGVAFVIEIGCHDWHNRYENLKIVSIFQFLIKKTK